MYCVSVLCVFVRLFVSICVGICVSVLCVCLCLCVCVLYFLNLLQHTPLHGNITCVA